MIFRFVYEGPCDATWTGLVWLEQTIPWAKIDGRPEGECARMDDVLGRFPGGDGELARTLNARDGWSLVPADRRDAMPAPRMLGD